MTTELPDDVSALDVIIRFVELLNKKHSPHGANRFKIDPLKKYVRIVDSVNQCVYCFVDQDLNVYKPASWAAPSRKHVATVLGYTESDLLTVVAYTDVYGSWLYRNHAR